MARSESHADAGATAALSSQPPPGFQTASPAAPDSGAARVDDTWQWWHHVRALCGHSTKLGVLLVVPITLTDASTVDRWLGEPVKAVLLPTAAFLTNRKGFPVLSRPHQDLLAKVCQHGIQVRAVSLRTRSLRPALVDGLQGYWRLATSGGRHRPKLV